MRALLPGAVRGLHAVFLFATLVSYTTLAGASVGQLGWEMNFGNVKVGQSKAESVILVNRGSASLTISRYGTNAPGFAVSGLHLPVNLAVGQSIWFDVVFTPLDGRNINGNIVVYSNASDPVMYIGVHGKGETCGTLTTRPTGVSFGDVPTGSILAKTEKLTNTGTCSITLLQANVSGTEFSRSSLSLPQTLLPGESVWFSLKFAPTVTGTASGSVTVVSSAVDSKIVFGLSGTGTGAGQLSITPSSVNFGNVTVGQTKAMSATMAASGASVTISSASMTSSEFVLGGAVLPLTLAAGQSKAVTLTFKPKVSATATASLSLASNAADTPTKVSLTGTGVSATAHSVTLSWSESTSTVVGYNVYRGSRSAGPFSKINSTLDSSRSYLDSTVLGGQTYYYTVTSVNSSGVESSKSAPVQAIIPSP